MAKSPTEQIQELKASLAELDASLQVLTERVENVKQDVEHLNRRNDELLTKLATLEERCLALQKLSDRGWQTWLALIGAGLAILVAFRKKEHNRSPLLHRHVSSR